MLVGFLRKQGLCSHVANLSESHFNNYLSHKQVHLKHQDESQRMQCGAWCISNWGKYLSLGVPGGPQRQAGFLLI